MASKAQSDSHACVHQGMSTPTVVMKILSSVAAGWACVTG